MIDTSAENLMSEVQDAIHERNKKLSAWKDSLDRYQGPDRANSGSPENASPENVEFQFIARRVPEMAFDLPAVRCDSPLMEAAEDVANFDRAMNRWIHSSNLRQVSEQTAVDFNLCWACIWVNRKPNVELGEVEMKGGKGVPYWPYMTRISPTLAFKDPRASNPYDMRFCGFPVVADKEDLLAQCDDEDEGWIRAAIEEMTEDSGLDKVGRKSTGSGPTRKEVTYYQVWVADAKIDWETEVLDKEGKPLPEEKRYLYNGKVFYIATTFPTGTNGRRGKRQAGMIRKPVPFLGPPTGPAVFFGEHIVPDDPDFMSTVTPNASTIRFMNQAIQTINRGIKAYKRIGIVSDFAEGLEDKIKNAPDLTIHTVSGYEHGQSDVLETGGVTNQMVAATDILRDRTDRGLGMDDAQYGRADDEASATAVAVASDSAGALSDRAKAQYISGIRRALVIVGFYLWYDEEFAVPISLQEALALGDTVEMYVRANEKGELEYKQPMVFGGTDKPRSYASLQLTIEPYSMERMSQAVATRNAATLVSTAATLAPLFQQNPGINGTVIMKALAKYTRIPEMEFIFDWKVMADMLGSQKMAEFAAAQEKEKPQLSGASKTASTPKSPASSTTPGATPPRVQPSAAPRPVKPGGMQGRSAGGAAGQQAKARGAA